MDPEAHRRLKISTFNPWRPALLLAAWLLCSCDPRGAEQPAAGGPSASASSRVAKAPSTNSDAVTSPGAGPSAGPSAGSSAGPAERPPLPAPGKRVPLAVTGFGEAVVAVPDTDRPRPIALATHGNYDRPSWQCETWQQLLGARAFVLCPRGEPRPDSPSAGDVRFTYPSNEVLEREIDQGLAALRERFASWLQPGPMLYTGFSLGAILGVKIAARHPARFPRLVLIEGGHDAWTFARVRAFAEGGGERVLFACGQKGCELAARSVARRLEAAGVNTRVLLSPGLGHTYGGPISQLIERNLDWLFADDERWKP